MREGCPPELSSVLNLVWQSNWTGTQGGQLLIIGMEAKIAPLSFGGSENLNFLTEDQDFLFRLLKNLEVQRLAGLLDSGRG
jgi:hypothetical protein